LSLAPVTCLRRGCERAVDDVLRFGLCPECREELLLMPKEPK
jgi:hypothetical protein